LWEANPEALEGHDEIVRGAVEGHGGVVFSEMGDGMAAPFASPGDAVGFGANGTVIGITITRDAVCRATNVVCRLDAPNARELLGQSVKLP
jgi:class 3 adenylate cyclase